MKYNLLSGVAMVPVCDVNLLVATKDAMKKVPAVKELNETGAFVWQMLKQDKELDEMIDLTAKEYEISAEEAKEGLLDFIESLSKAGYITTEE